MDAATTIKRYKNGGSFDRALYKTVTLADSNHLIQLHQVFPDLVDSFLLMTQGKTLYELYDDNKVDKVKMAADMFCKFKENYLKVNNEDKVKIGSIGFLVAIGRRYHSADRLDPDKNIRYRIPKKAFKQLLNSTLDEEVFSAMDDYMDISDDWYLK